MPIPYMATYAASKAFVRSFTEAITQECKPHNVQGLLLFPGLTKTNFNEAAGLANEVGRGLNTEYTARRKRPGRWPMRPCKRWMRASRPSYRAE